jgi:hypothetical protein
MAYTMNVDVTKFDHSSDSILTALNVTREQCRAGKETVMELAMRDATFAEMIHALDAKVSDDISALIACVNVAGMASPIKKFEGVNPEVLSIAHKIAAGSPDNKSTLIEQVITATSGKYDRYEIMACAFETSRQMAALNDPMARLMAMVGSSDDKDCLPF